jgi:hypothetical protein
MFGLKIATVSAMWKKECLAQLEAVELGSKKRVGLFLLL